MVIKKIIEELNFSPSREEMSYAKKESEIVIKLLKDSLERKKINAQVFIGGSFAKRTIIKREVYDIDIFVRFDNRYDDISLILERVINNVQIKKKYKIEKIHGSRDYFRLMKSLHLIFEIIPVLNIKKTKEARNITDLSYFHVHYIKKRLMKNELIREILLAKAFCKACGVYGAESYIGGFSGYGLECLIIYYKSLEKMLKAMIKVQSRVIIDPEKKYKNENEIILSLNEARLQSPVVLIDPTWKERNILAALQLETFRKFQDIARAFLKNPDKSFFDEKRIDFYNLKEEAKKKKAEFVHIQFKTNKQAGDIAGTKLKKFSQFLILETEKYFEILKKEFLYNEKQEADFYLIVKSKGKILKIGPPTSMDKNCIEFRNKNKEVFEKNGFLQSIINIDFTAKQFLRKFKKNNIKKLNEMGITNMEIY